MKSLLIKNAHIISPKNKLDLLGDILIKDGLIAQIGSVTTLADDVIDATGLVAAPAFFDMHVHLRDPGFTHKEEIATGCRAAAAGGFSGVACMPNTNPPTDTVAVVEEILQKAKGCSAKVYPVAAITKGQNGGELCDFAALKAAGAVAVSDDGRPVANAAVMQQAMQKAFEVSIPIISHCEDLDIIAGGIMNKGSISASLGVKGMDRTSEDSITAREIALAEATGTAIHIAHVSTKGSAGIIRDAKARGVKVTCESAPHYMLLTDKELLRRDANWRMNPPLREEADCTAIAQAFVDGTIDAMITDHAPHTAEEKAVFETAPNGIIGLETSFAGAYSALVHTGKITLAKLVELMAVKPREILGIHGGELSVGAQADIVLLDPQEKWIFTKEDIASKSANTPFIGTEFMGRVRCTLMGGEITYKK